MKHKIMPLLMIIMGLLLLSLAGYTYAQEVAPDTLAQTSDLAGEYVGMDECIDCHRSASRGHENSPHETTFSTERILADFSQGEAVRTVQFPGEATARPFTQEDVAFAVGTGRHIQRYAYAISEGEYRVFPAQWNTVDSVWEPFEAAASWQDPAYDWASCATCHTTGFDGETWVDQGVTCESCHGAGAEHVALADELPRRPDAAELAQLRGAITLSPDTAACATCHSNADGEKLPTGHALDKNMQYDEWLLSAHSTSLEVLKEAEGVDESCLTCHSTDFTWTADLIEKLGDEAGREPITPETAQFGVTCASCHNPHLFETENFMVADTESLCASCHANPPNNIYHPANQIFTGLPLVEGITGDPSPHFAAEDGPDCLTCHLNEIPTHNAGLRTSHTMSPVVPGMIAGVDSCTGCHSDLDPAYLGEFMTSQQAKVTANMALVQQSITQDSPAWVRNAAAVVAYDGSNGLHNTAYINKLVDALLVETGAVAVDPVSQPIPAQSPDECLECHQDTHRDWQGSPHANASQNADFLTEFANQGRPNYCMSCHASGYDPSTGTYAFEGVVCTTCHQTVAGEHPPAPLTPGDSSALCGQCHSGAHAPSYNEWLVSDHRAAGIDCVDCHTPHDNGLVLGDVNASCGDCHQAAMQDQVHMTEDLTCVDCHMEIKTTEGGIHVVSTGHTMQIDPGICSDCHGDIHALTRDETSGQLVDLREADKLQAEIATLQTEADNNRNTGVVGGALGMVIIGMMLTVLLRFRRVL